MVGDPAKPWHAGREHRDWPNPVATTSAAPNDRSAGRELGRSTSQGFLQVCHRGRCTHLSRFGFRADVQDVRGAQPGRSARRPTCRPRCTSRPASTGLGDRAGRHPLGLHPRPSDRLCLERVIFPVPAGRGRDREARGDDGLAVAIPRCSMCCQLRHAQRTHTGGRGQQGASVFYDPFGSYRVQPQRAGGMGTAVLRWRRSARCSAFTAARSPNASRRGSPPA